MAHAGLGWFGDASHPAFRINIDQRSRLSNSVSNFFLQTLTPGPAVRYQEHEAACYLKARFAGDPNRALDETQNVKVVGKMRSQTI